MRILLLGANGMLAHALARAFALDDITRWDQADLDITDATAVERKIGELGPELVLNAAAYTNVERAEDESDIAQRVNGDAVGFLAATCHAHNIPLVHVSTDYVFGQNSPDGYTEDIVPEHPLNMYGRTKRNGEEQLIKNTDAYWLVRTAWLFGEDGKNFVETMLRLGGERDEVRVVGDQHGSPTYTHDLADAIHALVMDRAPYGIYHFTNAGVTTWAEFAQEIFRMAGMTTTVAAISSSEFPTKARRPAWSILRNTKRPALPDWRNALGRYMKKGNS